MILIEFIQNRNQSKVWVILKFFIDIWSVHEKDWNQNLTRYISKKTTRKSNKNVFSRHVEEQKVQHQETKDSLNLQLQDLIELYDTIHHT